MTNEKVDTLYTFKQPVRGGYYYIVVKATSDEEAAHVAAEVVDLIKRKTDKLFILSQFPEGTLRLDDKMQARLDEVGYAHSFVRVPLAPYSERVGHRGFLPK